jgi:hypothetical protein
MFAKAQIQVDLSVDGGEALAVVMENIETPRGHNRL